MHYKQDIWKAEGLLDGFFVENVSSKFRTAETRHLISPRRGAAFVSKEICTLHAYDAD